MKYLFILWCLGACSNPDPEYQHGVTIVKIGECTAGVLTDKVCGILFDDGSSDQISNPVIGARYTKDPIFRRRL